MIYDPLTTRTVNGQVVRDPFPGNKIPANRISSIALNYLQGMPVPTDGRGLQTSAILNDGPQNQETLKIDHRWSNRMTTTGMYGHQYTKEPGTAEPGSRSARSLRIPVPACSNGRCTSSPSTRS